MHLLIIFFKRSRNIGIRIDVQRISTGLYCNIFGRYIFIRHSLEYRVLHGRIYYSFCCNINLLHTFSFPLHKLKFKKQNLHFSSVDKSKMLISFIRLLSVFFTNSIHLMQTLHKHNRIVNIFCALLLLLIIKKTMSKPGLIYINN